MINCPTWVSVSFDKINELENKMLHYDELKQAVDAGHVSDTVMIVRRDGKVFDFVLPGEPVRPWEVVCEEKVEDVLMELSDDEGGATLEDKESMPQRT